MKVDVEELGELLRVDDVIAGAHEFLPPPAPHELGFRVVIVFELEFYRRHWRFLPLMYHPGSVENRRRLSPSWVNLREEIGMKLRRVDMKDTLHPLLAYHPVGVMGSLVAGGPIGGVAKFDAEPLPERTVRPLRWRLVATLRRPRPATA